MILAARRPRVGRYLDLTRRLVAGLAVVLAAAVVVVALGVAAEVVTAVRASVRASEPGSVCAVSSRGSG